MQLYKDEKTQTLEHFKSEVERTNEPHWNI